MYFYNNGVGTNPSESEALSLIDEVVAFEKSIHSTVVEFTFARLWNQGLTELLSQMIAQKPLTGNGTTATDTAMDRERAYLIRWRAGVDSRGNPVYLRKWYHSCGTFGGAASSVPASTHANLTALASANRTAIATKAQEIYNIGGSPGPWDLCAKSGRGVSLGNTPECHRFLEHHQLGDQWRGA
jgi:hypothetical protein